MKHKTFSLFHIIQLFIILSLLVSPVYAGEEMPGSNYVTANKVNDKPTPYTKATDFSLYPHVLNNNVKNVILMIGDGMGLAHVNSTRFHVYGPDGRLYMERLPVTGISSVHSANRLITDSAASGTALSSGYKTDNKVIGQDPKGVKYVNIRELAESDGLSTGVVVTCKVTHATPACFYSHLLSRGNQDEIAVQLSDANLNVIFGGGWKYFIPEDADGSSRDDDLNLISKMEKRGYKYVTTRQDMLNLKSEQHVMGLFNRDYLQTEDPEPTLAEMTDKAIQLLDQDKDGFFLMVEGSQIDWEAHDNDFDDMLRQTILFDDAVRVAMEYAQKDGETLVIITADHETGGLTIRKGELDGSWLQPAWSTGSHSAVNVPIFAYGPGSLNFSGYIDNTDIAKIIAKLLGFEDKLLKPIN